MKFNKSLILMITVVMMIMAPGLKQKIDSETVENKDNVDYDKKITLNISLINSNIKFEYSDVSKATIKLYDDRTRELVSQPKWLKIKTIDNTIYIKDTDDRSRWLWVEKHRKERIFIDVKLPKNTIVSDGKIKTVSGAIIIMPIKLDQISLSTVSGNMSITDTESKKIKIHSLSGNIIANKVDSQTLDFDSVSSNIKITGKHKFIKGNTVSGDIIYEGSNTLKDLKVRTVSGNLEITVTSPEKYNLDITSLSGLINISGISSVNRGKFSKLGSNVIINDRSNENEIQLSSISGSILLNKLH